MRVENIIQSTPNLITTNRTQSINETHGFKDILKGLYVTNLGIKRK